jgi:phenylpropionate dioxygenase-like ring-hydroxylating dioxygenase large terminal subunit
MNAPREIPLGALTGLRNHWYMLGTSGLLATQPVALKVLGEELVLWRDGSGTPRLFPDTCAHRRARLSKGFVADGQLRCQYHGWTYDGSGQCTSIPTQGGECALSRKVKLNSYPVVERAGYFWAYIGDTEKAVPPLVLPPEYESPEWSTFPEVQDWNVNWLLILENLVDIMHAPFLHARSWFNRQGPLQDQVKVEETPTGFIVRRIGQQGVAFDWTEVHFTESVIYLRLDIPYNKWAGPGSALRIVTSVTPVDENRSITFFTRFRKVQGWRRTLWRALYNWRLRNNHLVVLGQDHAILDSQRGFEFAHDGERLAQSDLGVTWLRRTVRNEYESQAAKAPLMAQG